MKETLLMYARHTRQTNASAIALADALPEAARGEDRKSYFGSLAGLASHILDATLCFHRLFRASFPAAAAGLAVTAAPEGAISAAQ